MKEKIDWKKMHRKNRDGTCQFCGGQCESAESIKNWDIANLEIYELENKYIYDLSKKEKGRLIYLKRQIEKRKTFVVNY